MGRADAGPGGGVMRPGKRLIQLRHKSNEPGALNRRPDALVEARPWRPWLVAARITG